MGKRAWNSGFAGGMGKRAWNSGFAGGMGKRAWNSFNGGYGKRAMELSEGEYKKVYFLNVFMYFSCQHETVLLETLHWFTFYTLQNYRVVTK